jgi:Flp pilus assembly protein TadG
MLKHRRPMGQRGHAVVEVSLMAPWIFFLFVGTLDFGFYAYAAIATENAARTAVQQTSIDVNTAIDTTTACKYALAEMKSLPNMVGVTTCGSGTVSASAPLSVTVANPVLVGPDGASAAQVTVIYQTMNMISIPGLVSNQFTLVRSAEMRVINQ